MMDCKKSLTEAEGDLKKPLNYFVKKEAAVASKELKNR